MLQLPFPGLFQFQSPPPHPSSCPPKFRVRITEKAEEKICELRFIKSFLKQKRSACMYVCIALPNKCCCLSAHRVGDSLETMDLNAVLRRFGRLRRWEDACVVLPSCLLLILLLSIRKQLQMNFCSGEKEEEN
jgi:hypothetical protein